VLLNCVSDLCFLRVCTAGFIVSKQALENVAQLHYSAASVFGLLSFPGSFLLFLFLAVVKAGFALELWGGQGDFISLSVRVWWSCCCYRHALHVHVFYICML